MYDAKKTAKDANEFCVVATLCLIFPRTKSCQYIK